MAGIKFEITAFANLMILQEGSTQQIGNKNVIPINSGIIEFLVTDITKESKIKTISVAVGESPINTELGKEPKNIRMTGSISLEHNIGSLIKIIEQLIVIRKTNIDDAINNTNIVPIASVNNIIIPGMILKVTDPTQYLHQLPLNSEWLVSNSGTTRAYGTNHTYIIFTLTLTRWA